MAGNTLSCGCLKKERFQRANRYIDHTNLRQALKERVENPESASGYVGVAFTRGRWLASISHKGTRYRLGSYKTLEEAVAARKLAEDALMTNPEGFAEWYRNTRTN